jgi:hypothetical protein
MGRDPRGRHAAVLALSGRLDADLVQGNIGRLGQGVGYLAADHSGVEAYLRLRLLGVLSMSSSCMPWPSSVSTQPGETIVTLIPSPCSSRLRDSDSAFHSCCAGVR